MCTNDYLSSVFDVYLFNHINIQMLFTKSVCQVTCLKNNL